jgi:hypothetical protein
LFGFQDLLHHPLYDLMQKVRIVEQNHIHAAKQGMVLVTSDTRERYEAGLPPVREMVPINKLTPQDIEKSLLEELYFYTSDTMGPYVMRDSERAQRAIEARLLR